MTKKPKLKNFSLFVKMLYFAAISIFLFSNFYFLVSPAAAFAVDYSAQRAIDELCAKEGCPIQSPEGIAQILGRIVSWTYTIFFIVAVFFILVAAFNFLFARGDPEKIKSARSQILWAAVAIAVALISVGAAQIIKTFLKNPGA